MRTKIAIIITTLLVTAILLAFSGCENGPAYEGDLLDGQPHGSGTLTYDNSTTYSGSFENGLRHGNGIWIHTTGISYNGSWKDDIYHNWGKLSIPDYISYEGFWNEGKKDGHGIQKWPDGRLYDGNWQNGRMQGFGIMHYPDSSVYSGAWSVGRREGSGEFTNPEGETITGMWEKGQFVYVPVAAIALDQEELTLTEGQEPIQLKVMMLPFDATDQKIEWSSSEPDIATVDEDGLVVPLSPGEAQITVTAVAEELNASCLITVKPLRIAVESVTIDPNFLILYLDSESITLKTLVLPADATNKSIWWTSNRHDIATVNPESGVITPVSTGYAYITVKTTDGGHTATCMVNVRLRNSLADELQSPFN